MMRPHSLLTHLLPVGIIHEAYTGTPIAGWMPWEVQQDIAQSKPQKADADRSAKQQLWQPLCMAGIAAHPS